MAAKRSAIGFDRVAVVHDWLTGMRGGEVVLREILALFPQADLFTLLHSRGKLDCAIEERRIVASFIDRLPFKDRIYRHYLPLFPTAIEKLQLGSYDLVISSSHCVAKGVIPGPHAAHLTYVHSPMRYVWDQYARYFPNRGLLNRAVIPFFANYLRLWDAASNSRVDRFTCNSSFVAARIRKYYGIAAEVVHPPCIAEATLRHRTIRPRESRDDFYLIVSALVPYKRVELAVEAFRGLQRELWIVGSGPEEKRLRRIAPSNVRLLGSLARREIEELYSRARALLFPGEEDFGIVPVEAQSFGCPVIALGAGGALETVVAGRTGEFFFSEDVASIRQAMERLEAKTYRSADFRNSVARFTTERFRAGILREVARAAKGERSPRL